MTKEELIKALQGCEDAETLVLEKFCVRFDVLPETIYELFGGMRNLRRAAGIKFHWRPKNIDKNLLISELKRIFDLTKMPVTQAVFNKYSEYCSSDVANSFGTWGDACRIAEVPFSGIDGSTRMYNDNCVRQALKNIGVTDIEFEKSFDGLVNPRTGAKLRYDYYIKSMNLLIEIDGFTHYDKERTERLFKESFEENVQLDELKNKFAEEHGIKLLRIRQLDFNFNSLSNLFNLDKDVSFKFENICSKIEALSRDLPKDEVMRLYYEENLSVQDIANRYHVNWNLVYRLMKDVYGMTFRSVKIQKSQKMDVKKLIECWLNDVPYDKMPAICGAQNCLRKMQRILKECPSLADLKSLKKSGKAGSSQSDLKVEIYDRPPYFSFADGNI